MTPEELVQMQLDAYNDHDIDKFISTYSESIEVFSYGSSAPELVGMHEFKTRYEERFKNKKLKARVLKRIIKGNIVIDEEYVSGIMDTQTCVIAIYEVVNNEIIKVTFVR